jgi:Tfp pilus assembly protein PilO
MSFLPKNRQKRNQLFLAVAVTLVLIGGIIFGLIRPQFAKLAAIKTQTVQMQQKLKDVEQVIKMSDETAAELATVSDDLTNQEADMATGDMLAWSIDTIHHFKSNYKVDVPEIGQPSESDVDLLPHFPYKQIRFSIRGTGYYHDIGKFIADFENKYPHMRVVNLDIEPVGPDTERLSFHVDIIALVKSTS